MSTLLLAASERAFQPTAAYEVRDVEGWTVRVSPQVLAEPELCRQTLDLLRTKLIETRTALPPAAHARLRRDVSIWVERADPRFPGMCYHTSVDWLRANGYNPDKDGGIEIGNARNFLDWSRDQPAMVIHELAHAYRDQVMNDDSKAAVRAAYEDAKRGGTYDAVAHVNGRTKRAYAMNNDDEYFAELSEAYFAKNDFYPFVRAELEKHDPRGAEAIRRAWEPEPPAASHPTTGAAEGR